MIKNYTPIFESLKRKAGKLKLLVACIAALPAGLLAQTTYTFTSGGVTGQNGPTQAQVNTAYASTNLSGSVTVTGGYQTFTVPLTGPYRIKAIGGQGGYSGGYGASISGDFTLTAGTVLKILVGQAGTTGTNSAAYHCGGGGGGSYITNPSNVPYVVAGGGGGNGDAYGPSPLPCCLSGMQGTTSTSGNANPTNGGAAAGGTGGNGGSCGSGGGTGGAGAGITGNGSLCQSSVAALSFINGGTGGTPFLSITGTGIVGAYGGFGGGGGQYDSGTGMRGGGGGGYSGGGGGDTPTFSETNGSAGGGGSYNNGANPTNTVSTTGGDGTVLVTLLCDVHITASTSNSLAPAICAGQSVTLTTNAVSNYTWSNGNTTTNTIVVTPATTTTYTIFGTSPLGCNSGGAITVTVSSGVPTLAITSSTPSTCLGNTVSINTTGALTYTYSNGITANTSFTPPAGANVYTVSGANGCGTTIGTTTITVAQLPITNTVSSNLICAGKPATLTAGGANSYTWAPGSNTLSTIIVSPSSTTVYTITGQTGNCMGIGTLTITTKPNPTLSISANHTVICAGDAVNLTVTGNAASYTWSPGGQTGTTITDSPSNLTLYSVTGTNSLNCVSSANQPVLVNPIPVVNASVSNPLVCAGGASTLSASGASTYAWSGGANTAATVVNPTTNQTYSVTGTSSLGCAGSTMVTVSVYSPTISISSNTTVCSGNAAAIGAGPADSWMWSNNQTSQNISVSPAQTTVYTVTASVNNLNGLSCPASNSVQVTVNANPTITATAARPTICLGESTTLTAQGAGTSGTYVWTGGSGAVPTSTLMAQPIANQDYTVTGTDANGCKGKATLSLVVSICQGISVNMLNTANLLVYPNPSTGEFTISSDQAITLNISNELGQQVKVITLNKNTTDVRISNLPGGVYFITGKNENGSVKQKIVITK